MRDASWALVTTEVVHEAYLRLVDQSRVARGVTARTVRRDWVKAKSWLYAELYASTA